jgi:hypothetical protein
MRRPRNSIGRSSNPLRELLSERSRAAELTRLRQRERGIAEDLPSIIDQRVGAQMERLETKLVEGFREMGERVVAESTTALTSSLDGRISQLEEISLLQTETINSLRDSSRDSELKVSGVVNTIEKALTEVVPGFRLPSPSHLPPQLSPAGDTRELVKSQDRSMEDLKITGAYCPKCTSTNVRRASRSGMWEEFLRLFFIAPFRCRACRHKFYRF